MNLHGIELGIVNVNRDGSVTSRSVFSSPRKPARRTRDCVLGLLVLSVCLLTGSVPPSQQELNLRLARVKSMTSTERDRLLRHWNEFQALPVERQEHFRTLQRTVTAADSGLAEVAAQYVLWLQTLNPGQQEALRLETNPQRRAELVRQLREDQEELQQRLLTPLPDTGPPGPRWLLANFVLNRADLLAISTILEEQSLSPNDRKDLPATANVIRWARVLEQSLRGAGGAKTWPQPKELLDTMVAAVKTPGCAKRLQEKPAGRGDVRTVGPDADERWKRFALLAMFSNGLRAEARAELDRRQPVEEQLRAFFTNQLSAEARYELMRLPPEHFNRALTEKYFNAEKDPEIQQLIKVVALASTTTEKLRFAAEEFRRMLQTRPPRGGRPGGPPGRPGPGRPGPPPGPPREGEPPEPGGFGPDNSDPGDFRPGGPRGPGRPRREGQRPGEPADDRAPGT